MIKKLGNVFVLDTDNTTYSFRVLETGQLEHLYYGKKILLDTQEDATAMFEKHAFAPGNTNIYDKEHPEFSLEDVCLEMSSYGKGDIREPFVELVHGDGSFTSDFIYESAEITAGKTMMKTLPASYLPEGGELESTQLKVVLRDKWNNVKMELYYSIFCKLDIITRRTELVNESKEQIKIKRIMSNQVDFSGSNFVLTTFNGSWAREMERNDMMLKIGKHVNASYTGTSSSRANPFVMLTRPGTTEDVGDCYGFNLIYSGNHYEAFEVSGFGKLRFVCGINPTGFEYFLNPGENFEAPESVMTYSEKGCNGMSQNMHNFVNECIVRGKWKKKSRPVLLNSWEAAYFNINESKLFKLGKAAKDVGVELFVMDDGWFGKRDNDTSSLGDWRANTKKLPGGVQGIAKKINALGMDFGIWVEPEMTNVDSDFYREHQNWVMEIPGKPHTEGRNQRILDFANPEVVEYMTKQMEDVFTAGNISYVKWDMNRIVSDYYSKYLPAERQGEVAHRYVMGLYKMMESLTKKFPDILFEGCASGGNRFDLGILCYFPQIWASDNTDALCRVNIQTGYSYGYPLSAIGAHVSSCPNHQTLRVTPLETRFNVASFGVLGYECNLCDMSKEELAEIRKQIEIYKQWRELFQFGKFYRGRNGQKIHEWTCVSEDGSKAVGMIMQELVEPNMQFEYYKPMGLIPDVKYHFTNRNLRYNIKGFGDLVNTATPIHVKQDSLVHNVLAKFVTMPGETEDYKAYGSLLMNAGVKLCQGFGATGYNENVRYFQDFGSRLYFMEKL